MQGHDSTAFRAKLRNPFNYFFAALIANIVHQVHLDTHKESYFWTLDYSNSDSKHLVFIAALSLIADYFVLTWHLTTPVHPKFCLTVWRKVSLGVHILSGSIEIFCMATAFFSPQPIEWELVACFAAFLGHIPTAIYQWRNVFGVKVLMIPCYFNAIGLHFYTAFMMFLQPHNNSVGLLHFWLALHIYVWVRMSYYFLHVIGVFKGSEYSNAILLSGLLICPSLLGPSGNFIILFGVLVYRFLVQPFLDSLDLGWWVSSQDEFTRESMIADPERKMLAMTNIVKAALPSRSQVEILDSKALSLEVFRILDTDNSRYLHAEEIAAFMTKVGKDPKQAKEFAASIDKDRSGAVSAAEFYRYVWRNEHMRQRLILQYVGEELDKATIVSQVSKSDRAAIVFQAIDLNDSGDITTEELSVILTSWGLPESDAHRVVHGSGEKIDLTTFKAKWEYFWSFAYEMIQTEMCSLDYHIICRKKKDGSSSSSTREAVGATPSKKED
jgi:hypothetical protein